MPEIEALAKADGLRWDREARLAAWVLPWLPKFVAYGVAIGVSVLFDKDAKLPDPPSYEDLLKSLPDYTRDTDG